MKKIILACVFSGSCHADIIQFDDFSVSDGLQLNGNAHIVNKDSRHALRLTTGLDQAGTGFIQRPVSLLSDISFSAFFSFQITDNTGFFDNDGVLGADGITFIIQPNTNTAGASGGGIGYEGIDNSVAVEFDTWSNGAVDVNNGNHVGINLRGDMNSVAQLNHSVAFNNGQIWYSWIDFDGTDDLFEVRFSDSNIRPDNAQLALTHDLGDVFESSDVFFGFGSGTGAAGGTHDILSAKFIDDFNPIDADVPEPSSIALFLGSLFSIGAIRRLK